MITPAPCPGTATRRRRVSPHSSGRANGRATARAGLVWLLGAVALAAGGCETKTPDAGPHDTHDGATVAALADVSDHDGCRQEFAASHILVAWTGVRDCPRGLDRSREEAEERARRIALLLRTGRGDLGDLARRYSDDPSAQRNAGYLGVFRPGEMETELERLVTSLQDGQIGGPVATPYGWHVVRRERILKVRLHHLLIAHRDARGADKTVRRDRDDAARIARALQAQIGQPDADPCALAAQFSDDPQNRRFCGDLGWITPGLLEPEAERAVFALQPGEVSPVIESVFGFHIFWRQ